MKIIVHKRMVGFRGLSRVEDGEHASRATPAARDERDFVEETLRIACWPAGLG